MRVNVTYDRQYAQGDLAKAAAIAQKFNDDKPDLVHSISTSSSQAVIKLIGRTPVVFAAVSDPVGSGRKRAGPENGHQRHRRE